MRTTREAISGLSLGNGLNFVGRFSSWGAICALCVIGPFCAVLSAQDYLTSTGVSSFSSPYPAEMGTVDAASGNLHLEIPLGSFPQRGGSAPLIPRIIYDSHIWTLPTDGTGHVWTPIEFVFALPFGTWSFDEGGTQGDWAGPQSGNGCNEDIVSWDESGVQHWFNIPGTWNGSQCSGGTAYAADSSGFQLRQTAWGSGVDASVSLYAPDGTEVYGSALDTAGIASKDSNGNYLGLTTAGNPEFPGIWDPVIDTLGRTVVNPNPDGNPTVLKVLNSQGATSTYVVTLDNVPVKTNFQQSGITECTNSCTVEVITSISLPDGTSYSFLYDCDSSSGHPTCNSPAGQNAYYGTLTSMTLPTGDTVTYTYSNFKDAKGSVGRWLTSKFTTWNGYWVYTPTVTGGNTQKVTVGRPDSSNEVTSYFLDNSPWPTQILSYDTDGATLLSTVNNTWDFSIPCTLNACHGQGHQDVRKLSTSTTLPVPGGSITKQTTFAYDTPQTANITAVKEWKYQPGAAPTFSSVPDRATFTTYATIGTNNNINHPKTITVCNNTGTNTNCPGGGTPVAQTTITYDGYGSNGSLALQSVTGAVNHDDTNFGSSYLTRGNATQISKLISGTTYLTTAISYDTTGQVIKVVDSNGNPTTYSYTDAFYDDNGADPPATHSGAPKTNAYATAVTDTIGTTSTGYYYGSGQTALSTDYNGVTTYGHYVDPFDRPTATDYPIGWALNVYGVPSQNQTVIDSYAAVGDTNPTGSASCTLCTHTQAVLDLLGRAVTANLVNNPSPPGEVTVTSVYDGLNRVASSSHPHIGTSDPNNVFETAHYDGLGRSLGITHPDNENAQVFYGAYVTREWGALTGQVGSSTTYGVGFPVVSVDEAGNPRQEWIDGFGKVIEVDEPVAGKTPGQGSVFVTGSENGRYGCVQPGQCGVIDDSGTVSVTVNSHTTSVSYGLNSQGILACQQPGSQSLDTSAIVAARLAAAINSDTGSSVSAFVTGSSITLTSKTGGSGTNYTLSASSATTCTQWFPSGETSFPVSTSGSNLINGSNNGPVLSSTLATNYTYDVLGNLTGVVQGSQNRSYQYDGLSRLTQEITPEAGTVTLSYLSSGALCSGNPSNPCSRTAPAPNQTGSATVTTTYTYNTANQLKQKTHSDTTGTETYTYGTSASSFNVGRLITMTDPSGSEAYTYDRVGRVAQIVKTISSTNYTTKYAYNAADELTSVTYPSGRVVYYNYDNVGHLCQVAPSASSSCNATGAYLALPSGSYDAAGRPLSATYGNGVVATAAYSPQTFELASLSYAKGATTLLGLNYYYQQNSTYCSTGNALGNNGQIQCIADVSAGTGDSGRSAAYTYDPIGRLLTAKTSGSTQYPAWGLSWTYDRYANRTAQTVTAGSGFNTSYTINPVNNRITNPAFTYDASGNVTAEPAPLSLSYTYDGEECNTGYTGNGNTAAYTCDGNHIRVKKVVTGTNAVTTVAIRSGGQVMAEYDNGAAVTSPTREYLYGRNLLAIVTGSTGGSGGTMIYQHRDHLSPRLYTDLNGNDVGEQGTFPFGESWYNNNTTSSWVFTSYERDKESGNDYALARSYANSQGRFLAPDPLEGVVGDPQSWNRYAYVENDPINLSDPSGQGFWEDLGFAIANLFVEFVTADAINLNGGGWSGFSLTGDCNPGEPCKTWSTSAQMMVNIGAAVCAAGVCYTGGGSGNGPGSGGGWGGNTPESTGNYPDSGGSAPAGDGGPGAGTTDPGSTSAGNAGPGGGGGGDVAVDNDIWHNSARCPGCGDIWPESQNFVYWTMKTQAEAAALGGFLKYAGEAISALPKMRVAIGPGNPFHVAYEAGGKALNAVGELSGPEPMNVGTRYANATFRKAYFTFSVPIRSEAGVLATEGRQAWSCVTAAVNATYRGWFP